MPLSRPVAVSLADPSGGPVLARYSKVLPCPAAPSRSLSGLYLPSFSKNLVSGADLQDAGVDQFTPASQRVTHYTCAQTGRHLATFTRRPGSSLYTLTTESPPVAASGHVAASSQVFAAASWSGPESAPCSCRLLSHQTLLWHHRLGHPSLPRLRGMASRVLVSGFPRSLPPLPPGPAPTCVPCVEGRQCAAPHSSKFPPTEAPLKDEVTEVLIDWIRVARLQLRERFGSDFPYTAHQINLQPCVSLQETSPTLRWTGQVGDASAFRVCFTTPPRVVFCPPRTSRLTTRFRTTVSSPTALPPSPPPPLFLAQDAIEPVEVATDSGASGGAEPKRAEPGGAGSGGAVPERAESEGAEPGGAASGGAEPGTAGSGGVEPAGAGPGGPSARGAAGAGVSTAVGGLGAGGAAGAVPEGFASTGGAGVLGPRGGRPGGTGAAGPGGAPGAGATGGAGAGGAAGVGATGGAGAGAALSTGGSAGARAAGGAGAGGASGVGADAGGTGVVPAGSGGAARPRPYFVPLLEQVLGLPPSPSPAPSLECPPPVQSESQLQLVSPLSAPSPYAGPTGGLAERREPESRPALPVYIARTSRRVPRPRPPAVPGTHQMTLRPSTASQSVPLPSPPPSSLPALADPESDSLRAASPTVTRVLATVVTDPSFESTASPTVAELVDFAAQCRLDYAASLVAEYASVCPPSVGGCTRHPDLRSYAKAIEGPDSSQWKAAMDAEMASWKSTGTYVDEVPPPGANIVSGMWIFRVKRPPGSPPVFKARYVARGFNQGQGVDYFQTFSPTPKMTTLRVLLHVAAQRDYELHSLDFSTAFLQGSPHEEIWLRRPPGFTGSFPLGTQWSLRRPVYGLRQAPREWDDTLRTTLAALGFAPSTADPSLFLRTDTSLPPFYILVYIIRDRARRTITLTQSHMVQQVLQRFDFTYSSPQATPLSTRH
ncbi:unnamed protein product [Closterium sp. NIES-53]